MISLTMAAPSEECLQLEVRAGDKKHQKIYMHCVTQIGYLSLARIKTPSRNVAVLL
jgi:hypothetical protein